jgi:hypothetical protein
VADFSPAKRRAPLCRRSCDPEMPLARASSTCSSGCRRLDKGLDLRRLSIACRELGAFRSVHRSACRSSSSTSRNTRRPALMFLRTVWNQDGSSTAASGSSLRRRRRSYSLCVSCESNCAARRSLTPGLQELPYAVPKHGPTRGAAAVDHLISSTVAEATGILSIGTIAATTLRETGRGCGVDVDEPRLPCGDSCLPRRLHSRRMGADRRPIASIHGRIERRVSG